MSDEAIQELVRQYRVNPNDTVIANRLIAALLRERSGEPLNAEGEQPSAGQSRAIAFFIECRTGCTCCANENHYTGPWRSLKRVQQEIENYAATKRLASQYSSTGVYSISWQETEILPDGRIVIGDRIFGGFNDDPDYDGYNDQIPDSGDFFGGDHALEGRWAKPLPDWYVDPEAEAV